MKRWCMILVIGLLVACQPTAEMEQIKVVTDEAVEAVDESPIALTERVEQINGKTQAVREMMNCMAHEPSSLALYGYAGQNKLSSEARSASILQSLLYERLVTPWAGEYKARGIEALPNFEDGTAYWQTVMVQAGDAVVDINGEVVRLQEGMIVETAVGDTITFTGEPIEMKQLVAQFTLKPFIWSDGTPVTAEDSVRSYQMATRLSDSPNKQAVTANYEAIDTLTVQWTGIAGWYADSFVTHVWTPAPADQADLSARAPLSYGPFIVTGWDIGERITFEKNPYYPFESFSEVDRMIYEFIEVENG